MKIAIYGTKSYDREHFTRANGIFGFELEFLILCWMRKRRKWQEEREAVCIFVNDDGVKPVLEKIGAN